MSDPIVVINPSAPPPVVVVQSPQAAVVVPAQSGQPTTNASLITSGTLAQARLPDLSGTYALSPLVPADSLRAWGHSYVYGSGASSVFKGFARSAAEQLGLPIRMEGVSGTWLTGQANGDAAWPALLQKLTRPTQRFNSANGVHLAMYGINDLNKLGNTGTAMAPFKEALRVAVSRMRAAAIFEDNDATVTYSSGWGQNSASNQNSGGTYHYSATTGTTFTITTPKDFPGGTLAVGFIGRKPSEGQATVTSPTINGQTYVTSLTNQLTTTGVPSVMRIPNVPAGQAAYQFTVSGATGAFGAVLDYWQWEPDTAHAPLVVLVKQPKPLDYTLYGSVAPGPPTDAGVDALNQIISDVAAEFDSRVIVIDTSAMDHSSAYFIAGEIHPNDAGHLFIANLVVAAVKPLLRVQTQPQAAAGRVEYGTVIPSADSIPGSTYWYPGDVRINTTPTPGAPSGWVCTTEGTGTTGKFQALPALVAKTGTATLVAGTVTVADTAITANSIIRVYSKTLGGTPGALYVSAKTAATSFAITSTNAADTSTVQYDIVAY